MILITSILIIHCLTYEIQCAPSATVLTTETLLADEAFTSTTDVTSIVTNRDSTTTTEVTVTGYDAAESVNSTKSTITDQPSTNVTLAEDELKVSFNCTEDSKQIPQFLVCDDVNDCSNGDDESPRHCHGLKCGHAGIYCKPIGGGHPMCLNDTALYCDNKNDCEDGVDEDPRLCKPGQF